MQFVVRLARQHFGVLMIFVLSLILALVLVTLMGFDLRYFAKATMGDTLDGWFNQWTIYQAMDNLLHRPLNLGYSPIFYGEPASFADTIAPYGIAFQALPLFLVSHNNMELTYNCYFIATYVLTACAGYLLVSHVLNVNWLIAALAALLVGFAQWRTTNSNHIESLSMQFYVLALYALHRLIDKPRIRWAVALGLCTSLMALSSAYIAVDLVLTLVILVLYVLARHSEVFTSRFITMLAVAAIAGAILTWPFFSFRLANDSFRVGQPFSFTTDLAASPLDWLAGVSPFYHNQGPYGVGENALLLGITPLLLWLVAWRTRKSSFTPSEPELPRVLSRYDIIVVYTIITVVGYLLTLGPRLTIDKQALIPLPYMILYQLPGISGIRVTARFAVMSITGTAIMAAAAILWIKLRANRWIYIASLTAIIAGLGVELYPTPNLTNPDGALALSQNIPTARSGYFRWLPRDPAVVPVYQWLASQPADMPILQFPTNTTTTTRYLEQSSQYPQPMLNGDGSYFPKWYNDVNWNDFGNPDMMALLRKDKVRYIIVHHELMSAKDEAAFTQSFARIPAGTLRFVGGFGVVVVYEIV